MRLAHVTVTNFKSVEDSGKFLIGDVTCLVGKNEAGKTALLHALHRLNPDSGEALFDIQSSYPRRFLSEYEERHPNENALVLKTVWQLSDQEVARLKEIVGPKALTGTIITAYKRYNDKTTNWSVGGNEAAAAEYVLSKSGLHAEEQTHPKTIDALKKQLSALGAATNERHKAFGQHLEKYFKRGSVDTAITYTATGEADIEDLIGRDGYIALVKQA
jgi:ATPase subunit of ABC transporter with duplicated ATPase domains